MNSEASSQVAGWKRSKLTLATNAKISTRTAHTGLEAASLCVYRWSGRMDAGTHAPQGHHCALIMRGGVHFSLGFIGEKYWLTTGEQEIISVHNVCAERDLCTPQSGKSGLGPGRATGYKLSSVRFDMFARWRAALAVTVFQEAI